MHYNNYGSFLYVQEFEAVAVETFCISKYFNFLDILGHFGKKSVSKNLSRLFLIILYIEVGKIWHKQHAMVKHQRWF